jgi:hypothetical protein
MLNFFKKNKNIKNDNGLNEVYSKNGKGDLIFEFTRVNGVIEGEAIHYRKDGSIEKIENYKSGNLDGLTKIYDVYGVEIVDELNYVNGEMVASKKDIDLKNKFESIKDFMLKTRLIDSEFKVDFLEISQMSDETINSKSKELSESSKYDTEEVFYYLTYKRMFGIENFLNESEENDFDQTVESLFKNVDESFRENMKEIILEMNKRRTYFNKNGVYNDDSSRVKSSFTPELGWSYWRDNYSFLKNIYKYSRYDWTSTYLSVDEYFDHLKNTTSELFYLKPSQYLDLKMLFYQANQVKITYDKYVDDERKDNLANYIKNIIDGNINVEVNWILGINDFYDFHRSSDNIQEGKYYHFKGENNSESLIRIIKNDDEGVELINHIIEKNGTIDNFKKVGTYQGWRNLYDGDIFTIGILDDEKFGQIIRINKSSINFISFKDDVKFGVSEYDVKLRSLINGLEKISYNEGEGPENGRLIVTETTEGYYAYSYYDDIQDSLMLFKQIVVKYDSDHEVFELSSEDDVQDELDEMINSSGLKFITDDFELLLIRENVKYKFYITPPGGFMSKWL